MLVPAGRARCDRHEAAREWEKAKQDHERGSAASRGYGHRWRLRRERFLKTHPVCCDPTGRHPGQVVPATVADHIVPHRGDRELFEDPDNLQPLCASCHSAKTLRGE